MSFFYPKDVDFMEMFGCESHIDNDGLLESTFIDTQNKKMVFWKWTGVCFCFLII